MADEKLPLSGTLRSIRMRDLEGQIELIASLKKERSPKSIEALLEFLCDESWFLRERAASALMEVGGSAVPELLALAENGLWFTRACAVRILGKVGQPECTGRVLNLFEDRNSTVRSSVLEALMELAGQDGGESLANALLVLTPSRRETVIVSMRKISDPFTEQVIGMIEKKSAPGKETPGAEESTGSDVIDIQDIVS